MKQYIVGLDCGNSSFRTLLGTYDGETLTTEVIEQIPHDMVRVGEFYYWDILRILEGFKSTLKKLVSSGIPITSIGVCTWGVDFALFDAKGGMLGNPLSYRNEHGAKYLDKLSAQQREQLFSRTGILCDKINSVYLLQAVRDRFPERFGVADKLLMIPDILNYFLTGVMENEPSELSTTQLMDARTRRISPEVCQEMGIPKSLFCPIGTHGKVIGMLEAEICREVGLKEPIPVVCVPSHDTASAVAAIPAQEEDFAFISSGTWSLIGTELAEPIVSDAVRDNGLTNEVGAFGRITLLKNSAGMFLIQRIRKEYEWSTGRPCSWGDLMTLYGTYQGEIPLFPVNDDRFFNPGSMSEEIWRYLTETGQAQGQLDFAAVVAAVYHSMACSYAVTIDGLEAAVGKTFDRIYIVGGGSQNTIVNELTARYTGKTVVGCNKESTALGNIATQLCAADPSLTLPELRRIIARSTTLQEFRQAPDGAMVERYTAMTSERK